MSEVVPEAAPVEAAPVETEPAFQVSPEDWQATQDRLAEIQQVVQPTPQWQPQPQGPPIPDPFADNYEQQFRDWNEAQLAPYREFQQQVALQQAEEQAHGILDQHAATLGEFDRDMAWARANQLMFENGGDPNKALEQAAKDVREYERRVGEQYHQQQVEQVQTISGAPRVLQPGAAGAQTIGVGGYGNVPNAVTTRMFGRRT